MSLRTESAVLTLMMFGFLWLTASGVVTTHGVVGCSRADVMHLLVFSDMIIVDTALYGYMCIFLTDIFMPKSHGKL